MPDPFHERTQNQILVRLVKIWFPRLKIDAILIGISVEIDFPFFSGAIVFAETLTLRELCSLSVVFTGLDSKILLRRRRWKKFICWDYHVPRLESS